MNETHLKCIGEPCEEGMQRPEARERFQRPSFDIPPPCRKECRKNARADDLVLLQCHLLLLLRCHTTKGIELRVSPRRRSETLRGIAKFLFLFLASPGLSKAALEQL